MDVVIVDALPFDKYIYIVVYLYYMIYIIYVCAYIYINEGII